MAWYLWMAGAVVAETVGTAALQASRQFTRPGPSIVTVLAYGLSFWMLAVTLRTLPLGVAYAIWSALSVVLITLMGAAVFGQRLDWPAVLGLGMIVAGIVVINLWSETGGH